jgi:hypothetical protein
MAKPILDLASNFCSRRAEAGQRSVLLQDVYARPFTYRPAYLSGSPTVSSARPLDYSTTMCQTIDDRVNDRVGCVCALLTSVGVLACRILEITFFALGSSFLIPQRRSRLFAALV